MVKISCDQSLVKGGHVGLLLGDLSLTSLETVGATFDSLIPILVVLIDEWKICIVNVVLSFERMKSDSAGV